ncbi:hypothetical protein [Undibacterium sp. TJN19]|uniref:hypothetical protein n=1 Tax=Undibacterium sp. TJN19 TaxID=3413055 RepID=UPI003BF290EE
MFESGLEKTIWTAAIFLFFAQGWYLNTRLRIVHEKFDLTLEALDGLREYLYEIDPQFDDERSSNDALNNPGDLFSGANDMALLDKKKKIGKRTLNTSFVHR